MRGRLDELIDPMNCFTQQQEMAASYRVKVGEEEFDGDTSACVLTCVDDEDAKLLQHYVEAKGDVASGVGRGVAANVAANVAGRP